MGRPSRSTQHPLADHRAMVPRMTRSPGSPIGGPPSDGGPVTFADMTLLLCCGFMDTQSGLRPGGRPCGEEDCLDHAKWRFVRDGVVDRLQATLLAETGDADVDLVQHGELGVGVDHCPIDEACEPDQLAGL